MKAEEGVLFPRAGDRRSTARTGRAVFADAARAAEPALGERIEGVDDWRTGYVPCVRAVTAAGGRSAQAALAIADAGLRSARGRMVFVRDGDEVPLADALAREPAHRPTPVTVTGERAPVQELLVPYRGRLLRGDALRRVLAGWVERGTVEASFAAAVERVAAHPEWLRLPDRRVALIGAGAEMGPLEPLASWGADVVAVDVPRPAPWRRILRLAHAGAGQVTLPVTGAGEGDLATRAGLDVVLALPETRAWLDAASDGPLVLGMHAYADGAAHALVTAAADALADDLLSRRPGSGVAFLATPTDCYLVGPEVVADARRRWAQRGPVRRALQAPLRTAARGRLFAASYTEEVEGEDGTRWSVADGLVPQQGPNYALAKRLQRWRGLLARRDGHPVSFNVAPATWTRSVTKNRLLAAAYGGARRFGIEIFSPETTRVLMAAMLVHDLNHAPEASTATHPEILFADGAAHGGLWRAPYEPRSALGIAAVAGLHRALRPPRGAPLD